jgi:hypothetical protein
LQQVQAWSEDLREIVKVKRAPTSLTNWMADGYLRNVDGPETWRIRNVISQALESCLQLQTAPARRLARCAVLRTGQWALDMRYEIPSVAEFRDRLVEGVVGMQKAANTYARSVQTARKATSLSAPDDCVIVNAPISRLALDRRVRRLPEPRLILTSPPYPGVYVNYHRWKVQGRWETPAPFWIAGCLDGSGLATYTMSARSREGPDAYFRRIEAAWRDIAAMMTPGTWLVQLVGFSNPSAQADRYLGAMAKAGLMEMTFPELATESDGRLWRDVPGRRWWVRAGDRSNTAPHTATEVMLVHRLKGGR